MEPLIFGRYALTATLLSQTAFRDYLKHRGETYGSLATKVTVLGSKNKPEPIRCSKATVGHLATGTIRGTSPGRAKLIEEALHAPLGSLFVYKVSRVAAANGRAA